VDRLGGSVCYYAQLSHVTIPNIRTIDSSKILVAGFFQTMG
jgi:hypothetical protein